MLKAPGPHRREGGCHERVCVHWCPVCPVLGRINIKLFLSCSCSCFQLAHPRPLLLLLGASLRFTRPSLILPATSDYAATLSFNSPSPSIPSASIRACFVHVPGAMATHGLRRARSARSTTSHTAAIRRVLPLTHPNPGISHGSKPRYRPKYTDKHRKRYA